MELIFLLGFIFVSLILFLLVMRYRRLYLRERYSKSSISVRYGKFLEHYIPWMKEIFPYSPERFRFIGNPIDGILFGEDKIIFMEFKTGKSSLNEAQKKIKSLVESKKVEWKEVRTDR